MNTFEKAARTKLRFGSEKGELTVEDLWDLSLVKLNDMAKGLAQAIKDTDVEDYLETSVKKEDNFFKLRFDIVLHIIKIKQEENKAARDTVAKKERKQKILEIIAKKQDGDLEGKTEEQLLEELATLS